MRFVCVWESLFAGIFSDKQKTASEVWGKTTEAARTINYLLNLTANFTISLGIGGVDF